MGWLEEKWDYWSNGNRKGPFSKNDIRDLIERGVVTPETRLSRYNNRNNYSGEDDYAAIKTEFGVYFPRGVFIAATKDDPVPDLYMWLGLFAPLFLLIVIYFGGLDPRYNIWGFPFIFLWFADDFTMTQRGYLMSTRARVYAMSCFFACLMCKLSHFLLLSPIVYFYFRNKQLRRSLTPIWVSLACFLLIAGASYAWPRFEKIDLAIPYFE